MYTACIYRFSAQTFIYLYVMNLAYMHRPATPEAETLANYTAEVRAIATILKRRSKRWLLWS